MICLRPCGALCHIHSIRNRLDATRSAPPARFWRRHWKGIAISVLTVVVIGVLSWPTVEKKVTERPLERFSPEKNGKVRAKLMETFGPLDKNANFNIYDISARHDERDQNSVWVRTAVSRDLGGDDQFAYYHPFRVWNTHQPLGVFYVCGDGKKRYFIWQFFQLGALVANDRLDNPAEILPRLLSSPTPGGEARLTEQCLCASP